MAKTEILLRIKKAENDAKALIAEAAEAKSRRILEAKNAAGKIIRGAEEEAEKFAAEYLGKAKEDINREKKWILKGGLSEAEQIKAKAEKNVNKAAEYLIAEFERTVNA